MMNSSVCFECRKHLSGNFWKLIEADITFDSQQAIRSSGSPICPVTKLAVAICWLAGGTYYLDISQMFRLCDKSLSSSDTYVLWPTLTAIDKHLEIGLSLAPEDLAQMVWFKAHCLSVV
jgi:hypothetical protein